MAVHSTRAGFLFGFAACVLLLAYGFYLQYFDGQEPCPLCLVQRGFFFGLLFVFLVAAIHGPGKLGTTLYGVLALLLAAGGIATAGRQVWLQHLPADQVPVCGPDLYYMVDHFPLAKVITNLFRGSGQCAEVTWRFLGLSIAEWSLAWFVAFTVLALWVIVRRPRYAVPR
jgi:protein dithiol:quinone oxidoreductase